MRRESRLHEQLGNIGVLLKVPSQQNATFVFSLSDVRMDEGRRTRDIELPCANIATTEKSDSADGK